MNFSFFLSKRINTSERLIHDDEFKFQEHVEFSFKISQTHHFNLRFNIMNTRKRLKKSSFLNKDAELRSCGDITKRVCELNNKTRVMKPCDFIKRKGSYYYWHVRVSSFL